MLQPNFHKFLSRDELANALAKRLTDLLASKPDERAPKSVAFSGGSTPKLMLQEFGKRADGLDFENTTITLVDERRVAPTEERSNHKFLQDHLFAHTNDPDIMDRCFIPLFYGKGAASDDCAIVEENLISAIGKHDLTAVVLGMGTDGHTASWFPGGDELSAATNPDIDQMFVPMNAPGAGEERITMTASRVAAAQHVVLHIEGQEKLEVFERAREEGCADELPIRHVLRNPNIELHVYWAA